MGDKNIPLFFLYFPLNFIDSSFEEVFESSFEEMFRILLYKQWILFNQKERNILIKRKRKYKTNYSCKLVQISKKYILFFTILFSP